jgi:hypothetical protein
MFFTLLLSLAAVAIEGMTQLVDSTGSFHRSLVSNLPPAEGGIIALINPSPRFSFVTGPEEVAEGELQGVFSSEVDERCTLLLSPGANTIPMAQGTAGRSASNPVRSGYGCAAASVAAGIVILDGFETSDLLLENGETTTDQWKNSRLGRSLCAIFAAQAAIRRGSNKTLLMLCVNDGDAISSNQQQAVVRTAKELFTEVMETKKLLLTKKTAEEEEEEEISNLPVFEDLYDVMLVQVQSVEDAKKVGSS